MVEARRDRYTVANSDAARQAGQIHHLTRIIVFNDLWTAQIWLGIPVETEFLAS